MWCVCLSICCVCDSCAWIWICDKYLLHRNRYNSCERETIYQLIRSVLGVITLVLWWRLLYFFCSSIFPLKYKSFRKIRSRSSRHAWNIRKMFFVFYSAHFFYWWLICAPWRSHLTNISFFLMLLKRNWWNVTESFGSICRSIYLIIMTVRWVYVIDDLRSTLWCSKLLLTQPF